MSTASTPAIDNSKIVAEGYPFRPLSGMRADVHFVYVSPSVWELLHENYRGGPALEIFIVDGIPQFSTITIGVWLIKSSNEELR
jgi:hypothetical protein